MHNLGFSYQKARFVSDHLNEAKRLYWRQTRWPQIVRRARQYKALLLFGDEASFAQWGSLSYTWAPRGQQPEAPTSGKRKAYTVFGIIDYFSGRFARLLLWLMMEVAHHYRLLRNVSVHRDLYERAKAVGIIFNY